MTLTWQTQFMDGEDKQWNRILPRAPGCRAKEGRLVPLSGEREKLSHP